MVSQQNGGSPTRPTATSKSVTIKVYDDDGPWPNEDDLMDTIQITVPAANGVAEMFTAFVATTTMYSDYVGPGDYRVYGPSMNSSREQEAEIYFDVEDWSLGSFSNTVIVQAMP